MCARIVLVLLAPALLVGCFLQRTGTAPGDAGSTEPDAGGMDAEVALDAALPDAGPPDAGTADAGVDDAGPPLDSGPPDSGPPVLGPLPVTAGLLVHFDAQNVLGDGTIPGSSPGNWIDLTGGNDGACSNVRYDPNGLSTGRPAMVTEATDASSCQFDIPDLNDLTIAVVIRTGDTRGNRNWYDAPCIVGGEASGETNDGAMYMSEGRVGFARRNSGTQYLSPAGTSYADDMPHAMVLARRSSVGNISLWVDTAGVETGTANGGAIDRPNTWWLAGSEAPRDTRFAAAYAEVLVYTRELSETEATSLRDWLLARWGI